MRRTCEECKVNVAYRWFLGLSIYDDIPNYSTWSQNYIRRYKDSNIFEIIFDRILEQAIDAGFVDMETVFGDSTHQKAENVNIKMVKNGKINLAKNGNILGQFEEVARDIPELTQHSLFSFTKFT